jgi:hypothetical protein
MIDVPARRLVTLFSFAVFLLARLASAQSSGEGEVPDRFRLEVGGFRIGSDTNLTFNTGGTPSTPVDFESLQVPEDVTRFYVEGFWRPWRRHQFSLAWFRNSREGEPTTTTRDFTWGDRVVTAGATVTARASSDYFAGVYRFAAYKNDRFEIGPSLGIGYLSAEAGIAGNLSVSAGGAATAVPFDLARDLGQITGDLGGYLYWWPARRLLVRGDLRYILVKPENSEASVTDGRAAILYHPWPKVGFGFQYVYSKFRYEREIVSRELGGSIRYSGGQIVLAGAF